MPKLRTFFNYDLTVSPKRLGKTLRVTKKSRKAARRKCQVVLNTSTRSENSTFSRVSANSKIYDIRCKHQDTSTKNNTNRTNLNLNTSTRFNDLRTSSKTYHFPKMSASILDDWLTWVKVLIERLPKNFVIISKIFAAPPVNVIINTRKETRLET